MARLGAGGQAVVFSAPAARMRYASALVYKEYRPEVRDLLDVAVLEAMPTYLESLPAAEGLELLSLAAWPCRLVESGGQVCGFVMPAIPDEFYLAIKKASGVQRTLGEFQHLLNAEGFLARRQIPLTDRHRFELLAAAAQGLSVLHRHGIVVGDLSPKNLLFSLHPVPRVYFIDCDAMSFQGRSVIPQLETPDWEVRVANPHEGLATLASDKYKLALLALRLLAGDQTTRDPRAVPGTTPGPVRDLIAAGLAASANGRPEPEAWEEELAAAAEAASSHPPRTAVGAGHGTNRGASVTQNGPSVVGLPTTGARQSGTASGVNTIPGGTRSGAVFSVRRALQASCFVFVAFPLWVAMGLFAAHLLGVDDDSAAYKLGLALVPLVGFGLEGVRLLFARAPVGTPRRRRLQIGLLGAACVLSVWAWLASVVGSPDRPPAALSAIPTGSGRTEPQAPQAQQPTAESSTRIAPGPTAKVVTPKLERRRAVPPLYQLSGGTISRYSTEYAATVTGVRGNGYMLQLAFRANGLSDLRHPASSCLRIAARDGQDYTAVPIAIKLTTDTPGAYEGTMTFPALITGTYSLNYSCQDDYSYARIGKVRVPSLGVSRYSGEYYAVVISSEGRSIGFVAHGPPGLREPGRSCLIDGSGKRLNPRVALSRRETSTNHYYRGTMSFDKVPLRAGFLYSCVEDYTTVALPVVAS